MKRFRVLLPYTQFADEHWMMWGDERENVNVNGYWRWKKNEKIWVEFLQWMATTNDTEHSRFSAVAAVPSIHFFPLKSLSTSTKKERDWDWSISQDKREKQKKCLKMLNRKISPHRLFCLLSFLFFIDHLILSLLRLLLSARFLLALKFYLYSQTQRFNRELELLREWGGCLAFGFVYTFRLVVSGIIRVKKNRSRGKSATADGFLRSSQ